jgi:hypothetical protein
MDVAKRRVFPPSLPGTEPIRISPLPCLPSTKRYPPACRQGAIPELNPLGLGEGHEGPGEARGALWANGPMPLLCWRGVGEAEEWSGVAAWRVAGKPCREQKQKDA